MAVGSRMVQGVIETVCKIVIDILNFRKVFPSFLFEVPKIFLIVIKSFRLDFKRNFLQAMRNIRRRKEIPNTGTK